MKEQTLLQIECILEQAGSVEVADDVAHRYALRRALLNSPRFEQHRIRIVWTRLFTYSTTLVAGGAVIAVMVVSIMTVELRETAVVAARVQDQLAQDQAFSLKAGSFEAEAEAEAVEAADTSVHFASFEDQPNMRQVLEFARPDVEFAVVR